MGPRDGDTTGDRETLFEEEIVVVIVKGDKGNEKTGDSEDREVTEELTDGEVETLCDLEAVFETDVEADVEAEGVEDSDADFEGLRDDEGLLDCDSEAVAVCFPVETAVGVRLSVGV